MLSLLKDMKVKHKSVQFFKQLLITICAFFSWWGLTFVFIALLNWTNTEHYKPDDVPNERFRVQIFDEKGIQHAKSWAEIKHQPHLWATEVMQSPYESEDFLIKKNDGSLMYHDEGALWNTQSHYRIEGKKLIPISFLFFNMGTVLFAIVMASATYSIFKYAIKRWLYRHSREQTQAYNQAVYIRLKNSLVWFGMLISCYIVISYFRQIVN